MIPFIQKYLLENWGKFEIGPKPDKLLFTKFADRRIRAKEVAVVSFQVNAIFGHDEKPVLILRIPRYPENQGAKLSLEREYKNLSDIQNKLHREEIPRPILFETINASKGLAMTFLSGSPINSLMLSQNIMKAFTDNSALAFSWLIDFQTKFGKGRESSIEEIVSNETAFYLKAFPQNALIHSSFFEKIIARSKEFRLRAIPLLPQHEDFHAENIFIRENKVSAVIDWEDFEPEGLPAFDVIHFIKTYLEALFNYFSQNSDTVSIEKLSTNKEMLDLIKSPIQQYLNALGIEAGLMEILIPLYLIHSINLAANPRKNAVGALSNLELLLRLKPTTIDELLLFMSAFSYGIIYGKAMSASNQKLAAFCKDKIESIQNNR